MTVGWRSLVGALITVGSLVLGGSAASADVPSTASNMGLCSSYLGQMQVRDDVNQTIKDFGDVLGLDSPGALYSVRAHQHVNGTPQEECQRRPQDQ
jgi:hypothetical protein